MGALLPLLLLGCSGAADFDLDGVWRFEVEVLPAAEDRCVQRVLHNAAGLLTAEELAEEIPASDWTEETSSEWSSWTGLGRLSADGDRWLLVIDGLLLVQEEGATDAQASFAWERFETSSSERVHSSGYEWRQDLSDSAVVRLFLDLPSEQEQTDAERAGTSIELSGSWTQAEESVASYEESDQWPAEAKLGEAGSIPMGSYLYSLDEFGAPVAGSNTREAVECSDTRCVLSVTTSCQDDWALRATKTGLSDEEFEASGAGWEAGY